jgi:hypothetical protein
MSNAPLLAAPNYQSRWAYAVPDNYLGGVEGANLPAGAVWAGMSARNIALCGGSATLPSGGGSQSQGFKYGVFKSRPVKIPHA